jgi:hypothetical protein
MVVRAIRGSDQAAGDWGSAGAGAGGTLNESCDGAAQACSTTRRRTDESGDGMASYPGRARASKGCGGEKRLAALSGCCIVVSGTCNNAPGRGQVTVSVAEHSVNANGPTRGRVRQYPWWRRGGVEPPVQRSHAPSCPTGFPTDWGLTGRIRWWSSNRPASRWSFARCIGVLSRHPGIVTPGLVPHQVEGSSGRLHRFLGGESELWLVASYVLVA